MGARRSPLRATMAAGQPRLCRDDEIAKAACCWRRTTALVRSCAVDSPRRVRSVAGTEVAAFDSVSDGPLVKSAPGAGAQRSHSARPRAGENLG
jgi:hypothetical protein